MLSLFISMLKTGTQVQIQRPGAGTEYMCKVEVLIEDAQEVLVHAPRDADKPVMIDPGENLNLRIFTDSAIYRYRATMVARTIVDGFGVIRLRINDSGEKVQRRSNFRFNCAIPVTFNVVKTSGEQGDKGIGIITDLSAGGTKIFSDAILSQGSLLNIQMTLGTELLVAFGDVRTRTELPARGSKYKYQYGVRFSLMPEADQEIIIRYMYKLQREALKKVRPR